MEISRDPRVHHIEIDKTKMSTHPDLALEITFGQKKQRRTIEVVLEVRTIPSFTGKIKALIHHGH